jgi:hypothetical protein
LGGYITGLEAWPMFIILLLIGSVYMKPRQGTKSERDRGSPKLKQLRLQNASDVTKWYLIYILLIIQIKACV